MSSEIGSTNVYVLVQYMYMYTDQNKKVSSLKRLRCSSAGLVIYNKINISDKCEGFIIYVQVQVHLNAQELCKHLHSDVMSHSINFKEG